MKNILLLLLCLTAINSFGQTDKPVFDAPGWKAPYTLSMEGWGIERFLIPIEFAPKILYTGVEDLRFTKGWGDSSSNEYWSYAFLWFLDGKVEMTEQVIKNNLQLYYDGLVGQNIEPRKIPAEKIIPTKAIINQVKTVPGDVHTFSGTIYMLDYMTQTPMTLHCVIHCKACTGHDKTFIFYEISPKPATDDVWKKLNNLWINFSCSETITK